MPSTVFFVGVGRSFALVLWFVFVGVGVWLCDVVLIEGCNGCCKCWCTGTYHKGCVVRTQSCFLVLIWLKCFFYDGVAHWKSTGLCCCYVNECCCRLGVLVGHFIGGIYNNGTFEWHDFARVLGWDMASRRHFNSGFTFLFSHSSVCRAQPFIGCGLWLMSSIWDVVVALKTFVSFLSFKLIFPCCLNFLGAICSLVFFADAKAVGWVCSVFVKLLVLFDWSGDNLWNGLMIALLFLYPGMYDIFWIVNSTTFHIFEIFTGREFVHLVAVCWGSA